MSTNGKTEVRFFLSYASANAQLAKKFKDLITEQFAPSKKYHYKIWQDSSNILPGEDWDTEIKKALEDCGLGLLLITPSFLASKYITENELPEFVGTKNRTCIPVKLSPVNMEKHDLKGLEKKQMFSYMTVTGTKKNFSDCNPRQRRQFCENLYDLIENRLDKIL